MKNFFKKTFTSRKFWAAVASSIPFAIAGDWNSFAYVWMGYASILGTKEAVESIGSKTTHVVNNNTSMGLEDSGPVGD